MSSNTIFLSRSWSYSFDLDGTWHSQRLKGINHANGFTTLICIAVEATTVKG